MASIATKAEVVSFLRADADGYFRSLTDSDLHARGSSTVNAYIKKATNAIVDPNVISDSQKRRVLALAQRAKEHLFQERMLTPAVMLAFMDGVSYENGLPHTRSSFIFMQIGALTRTDHSLLSLLVHELVHIWQRYNPKEAREVLEVHGYRPIAKKGTFNDNALLRANPDTDDNIYIDKYGQLAIEVYTSFSPESITDAVGRHPYEIMAYSMQDDLAFDILTS